MFDELRRELRKLERGIQAPVNIVLDENGYLDRSCPSQQCQSRFKVLFSDWQEKVEDECAYCANCRYAAPADKWNTTEQDQYISQQGLRHIHGIVDDAISRDIRRFNQSASNRGLVHVAMNYRPGAPVVILPTEASKTFTMKYICGSCGCQYSSLGSAFFCPACGYNGVNTIFFETLNTINKSINSIEAIHDALKERTDEHTATNAIRHLCENELVRVASALQRYAEAQFEDLPNRTDFTVKRNVFQRLDESSQLWQDATGKGYEDMLEENELECLRVFFQQRHLLVHREGVVDQVYIDRSHDTRYAVGQRIVIHPEDVQLFATVSVKLGHQLNTAGKQIS